MALIAQGARVTLVDVGQDLEPDRRSWVESLSRRPHTDWAPGEVARLKEPFRKDSSGILSKLLFGSDYPYRNATELNQIGLPDGSLKASIAQGGLSTVWGASVLPYNDRDLERWPISASDLRPHYEAVLQWMPLMAAPDDLESLYPIDTKSPKPVRLSRPAAQLLRGMNGRRSELRKSGFTFGHSRVALRSDACTECGACLHGCPYRLIYNAADTLPELRRSPNFKYLPGIVIDRLEESGTGVKATGREIHSKKPWSLQTDRVFLGAGVLPTARIALESAGVFNEPVRLLDSQYTVMPMVSVQTHPGIEGDPLHTLCQLYLEIDDPAISRHNIHAQLYTYNSMFLDEFRTKALGLLPKIPGAHRHLLTRLMVGFGYLHSDDSGCLQMVLKSGGRLEVDVVKNPRTAAIQSKVAWKLLRNARHLGFAPLLPLIQKTAPGRGFHNGGSFPMGPKSDGIQSDTLGRPFGWRRIHIVDSSVFPTIPAATITFTAMANAHRIASLAAQL
ncbi:MAG: GMC oxidoreductase [Limisphaerales bacterium]